MGSGSGGGSDSGEVEIVEVWCVVEGLSRGCFAAVLWGDKPGDGDDWVDRDVDGCWWVSAGEGGGGGEDEGREEEGMEGEKGRRRKEGREEGQREEGRKKEWKNGGMEMDSYNN